MVSLCFKDYSKWPIYAKMETKTNNREKKRHGETVR